MLCSFCPRTIWATSLGFCRTRPESSAHKSAQSMQVKRSDPQKIFTFSRPEVHLRVEKGATPYKSLRALRARRPPRSARERVSPKSGVCLEVSEGVLQGSFEPRPKMCPKSDLKVSKKTLLDTFKSFLEGPQGHFPRHFRTHPDFWRDSLGHSQGHFGPEGPEDSCRGPASSQLESAL